MKKIEDERIIAEKRKINSNAFGICFMVLWGILLYRQFILNQDIMQYMDIFLLAIGLSIYLTVNSVLRGLYLTYRSRKEKKRVNLIGATVGSMVFAIIQIFILKIDFSNPSDIIKIGILVIIFFVVWMISQNILLNISESKANKDVDD